MELSTLVIFSAVALPVLTVVLTAVCLALQPSWAVRWARKHWPNVLFFQPTRDPVVALTIDDGPHRNITPELLEIMKENKCHATWFIIGDNMDRCPELVEQMHREGHEVANHTMYDVPSWKLSPQELEEQLLAVDRKLAPFFFRDHANRRIKWFRPGHGFFTKQMLKVVEANGYKTALGSLYPHDTVFTDQGKTIAKYLLWRIHNGAVIVLHDREPQRLQTAKVLRILLPELRARGISVVTLSELLNLKS